MNCTRRAIILAGGLTIARPPDITQERRNGNWWRTLTGGERLMWAIGAIDGTDSCQDLLDGTIQPACGPALFAATASLRALRAKATAGQIRDGLSEFYADYRNRSIMVYAALGIIYATVAGFSDAQIQALTEEARRNA